ncbi:MAG: VWA domain-containing protein [Thermanaerothrix sp.]|nr:VWA domain-containing protein [Thermanaerothrix sp.]
MEQRIAQFIAALRTSGVRISLAESADAFQAVERLGIQDRERFRLSLRATLIKEARDIPVFERLFPLFFQPQDPPPLQNVLGTLTPQEARLLAEALRQLSQHLQNMLQKLLAGQPLSSQELEELDALFNADLPTDPRYRNWLARKFEAALRFDEVRKALEDLLQHLREMGLNRNKVDQIRRALQANLRALQDQLHQYAGERILEAMAKAPRQPLNDGLLNRPLQHLTPNEMHRLRREVQRLAAILRTRLALRMKRARNGQLDPKATLRTSLRYGLIPLELRHKDHALKPKLVVICDISTSMRFCSELMLSLLYALQDQIGHTHAFAFIDHLEYISPDFERLSAEEAITQVLQRMPPGYYNTNLGFALSEFDYRYLYTLDRRTTLIVVGDGRNNYNDPRADLLERFSRRARKVIWLNPEPPWLWGSGDSDMLRYLPYCTHVFQVANLNQLTAAVDRLLTH